MAEDAAVYVSGSTYGYTDAELGAMPVWLMAVRLGFADGSDGYPKGARRVMSKADIRAHEDAAANRGVKAKVGKAMGRFNANRAKPQTSDPGRVLSGDDAR